MRITSSLALGVSALAWTTSAAGVSCQAPSAPYCPPRSATPDEQRVILDEFIQAFYAERNVTKALLNYVSEDYIQHNPNILSGQQNALNALAPFLSPNTVTNKIIHKVFDNNIAQIHYRMDLVSGGQPSAVVDVFRFNGTCIMEHWDVSQQKPVNATNPLAMF